MKYFTSEIFHYTNVSTPSKKRVCFLNFFHSFLKHYLAVFISRLWPSTILMAKCLARSLLTRWMVVQWPLVCCWNEAPALALLVLHVPPAVTKNKVSKRFKTTLRRKRNHCDHARRKTRTKNTKKQRKKKSQNENKQPATPKEKRSSTKQRNKRKISLHWLENTPGPSFTACERCFDEVVCFLVFSSLFFCFLLFLNCSDSSLEVGGNINCLQVSDSVKTSEQNVFMCSYMFFLCIL